MVMRIVEGVFTVAFVALILTHANGFAALVTSAGNVYSGTVTGLQGRTGGY